MTMSSVQEEISALEERLRLAELGPEPGFFEEALPDDAVLVSEGKTRIAKAQIVQAHQPGKGPKFTRVEMRGLKIVDHGVAAVVTCEGIYEHAEGSVALKFMRVWLKK